MRPSLLLCSREAVYTANLSVLRQSAALFPAWDPVLQLVKKFWRDFLVLFISLSCGSMGFLSLHNPLAELVGAAWRRTDLKSVFCLVVFTIVSFVIAYLTNPTENSFRAYLTEQSFRLHLSCLDDNVEDDHKKHSSTTCNLSRRNALALQSRSLDDSASFHFANRASISLRTPKHAFHSFGLFTIAAVVPLRQLDHADESDSRMICDSWYIGAFGHWWRGGIIEAWYHDVIARAKDQESWNSGVLHMNSLDIFNDYNGLPFSTKNLPSYASSQTCAVKFRKEKSFPSTPPRSSTPPPLPKSVSLPLHTSRIPIDRSTSIPSQPPPPRHACQIPDPVVSMSSMAPLPALFDNAPHVAEVVRQINISKTTVLDLRNQLSECQSSASQIHLVLQKEVEGLRERKRKEDVSKAQVKSRTKTLDDSKRQAETFKRDADKKLKAAKNIRETAIQRIAFLDKEISLLKNRIVYDEDFMHRSDEAFLEAEKELSAAMEMKRQEIKNAEDMVIILNQRARELEGKLSEQKQKLEWFKKNRDADHNHEFNSRHWLDSDSGQRDFHDALNFETLNFLPERGFDEYNICTSAILDNRVSVNLAYSATGGVNNPPVANSLLNPPRAVSLANGHATFDGDKSSMTGGHYAQNSSNFTLFKGDRDIPGRAKMRSPVSHSLVPPTLMIPLEEGSLPEATKLGSVTSCPLNLEHDVSGAVFEVSTYASGREPSHYSQSETPENVQHLPWMHDRLLRSGSDALILPELGILSTMADGTGSFPWPVQEKRPEKGLNPDAKEFNLPWKSPPAATTYDALNPNGIGSTDVPSSTSANNSSILRAFAPSPAEREALQRALSGCANASFERLPSLSDVGGIPPSVEGALVHPTGTPRIAARERPKTFPPWLDTFPRNRKPNFSPWDDEEPVIASEIQDAKTSVTVDVKCSEKL